jgi:hypothetical protein
MQLVLVSVFESRPDTPRRRTVNMSSRPSQSEAAASGWSRSSSTAMALALARPTVGSGWLNAPANRRSIRAASSLGRLPVVRNTAG